MGAKARRYILQRRDAFLVFGLCGACGVAIDVDHIIAYEKGWNYLVVRPFHTPILIIGSIVLGCCLALLGGLFAKLVLKK